MTTCPSSPSQEADLRDEEEEREQEKKMDRGVDAKDRSTSILEQLSFEILVNVDAVIWVQLSTISIE